MNRTIKTGLAAIMLIAISCTKENNTIQSTSASDNSSTSKLLTDINDPDVAAYVKIGTQKWMVKNLNVSRYRNGDLIPYVKSRYVWDTLTSGAWCWYNNDSGTSAVYGKLYNWYAVHDKRGLAPIGWHVPSDAEWDTLSARLGGDSKAGGKLKDTGTVEAGTGLWYAPNTGATNKSGFSGLPGGFRYDVNGQFINIGYYGLWWSSTESINSDNDAWYRFLEYNTYHLAKFTQPKRSGFSVRCLKD